MYSKGNDNITRHADPPQAEKHLLYLGRLPERIGAGFPFVRVTANVGITRLVWICNPDP